MAAPPRQPITSDKRVNEARKFTTDSDDNVAVNTVAEVVKGAFTPSGLQTAGKDQEILLNSTTWTELPITDLEDTNSIRIQNQSGTEIKTTVNADPNGNGQGYVGVIVPAYSSDFLDKKPNIPIYGMAKTGTSIKILLRELA